MKTYVIQKDELKKFLDENKSGGIVDWKNLEYNVNVTYDDSRSPFISFGLSSKGPRDRYYISLVGFEDKFLDGFYKHLARSSVV